MFHSTARLLGNRETAFAVFKDYFAFQKPVLLDVFFLLQRRRSNNHKKSSSREMQDGFPRRDDHEPAPRGREGDPLKVFLTRFSAIRGCGFPWSWAGEEWKKGSGVPAFCLSQEKGACLGPHVISSRVTEP